MPPAQVSVVPPTGTQSGTPNLIGGRSGEVLDTRLHTDFYTAALNGKLFQATTLTAGTIIPVQATNLVSTFTIWNPLGSGVNVELVRYTVAWTTTVEVVSPVALWIQTAVGGANAVPSALTTPISVRPALWGGSSINPIGSGGASMWGALTLVNTMATNMWQGPILFGPGAVTSTNNSPINYDFQGTTVLGPGTLATTAGFAAQTAATSQTLIWMEWPV